METYEYGERLAIMKYDGGVANASIKALSDFPSGFVIYAGWVIEDARKWIKENNLTEEDVRLVKNEHE